MIEEIDRIENEERAARKAADERARERGTRRGRLGGLEVHVPVEVEGGRSGRSRNGDLPQVVTHTTPATSNAGPFRFRLSWDAVDGWSLWFPQPAGLAGRMKKAQRDRLAELEEGENAAIREAVGGPAGDGIGGSAEHREWARLKAAVREAESELALAREAAAGHQREAEGLLQAGKDPSAAEEAARTALATADTLERRLAVLVPARDRACAVAADFERKIATGYRRRVLRARKEAEADLREKLTDELRDWLERAAMLPVVEHR